MPRFTKQRRKNVRFSGFFRQIWPVMNIFLFQAIPLWSQNGPQVLSDTEHTCDSLPCSFPTAYPLAFAALPKPRTLVSAEFSKC